MTLKRYRIKNLRTGKYFSHPLYIFSDNGGKLYIRRYDAEHRLRDLQQITWKSSGVHPGDPLEIQEVEIPL